MQATLEMQQERTISREMTESETPTTLEDKIIKTTLQASTPLREHSSDDSSPTKSSCPTTWSSSSSPSDTYFGDNDADSNSTYSNDEDDFDTTYSSNGSGYSNMDSSSNTGDSTSCKDNTDTSGYSYDASSGLSSYEDSDDFCIESMSEKEMNESTQKQANQFEIDKIKDNVDPDTENNGTLDRTRMSFILNLLLNKKTLQEIVKDIADGILDFKEIEEIFPWKFVQDWRQCNPNLAKIEGNEFKNMTDERMQTLLTFMLNRKSRDELLELFTDHTLGFDNVAKSFLRFHMTKNKVEESSTVQNVSKLPKKNINNVKNKNSKEPKDSNTKKRNMAKKGEKESNNLENVTKKVHVIKLKNEKRVGDINDGNKIGGTSKEISSTEEENPLPRENNEKASSSSLLTESLMQTRHEGFEESSLKSPQCDTTKTAKSKSLANDDKKLASGKKVSKKIGKDVKPGRRNKEKQEVGNIATLWRNDDDRIEEKEKLESDESNEDNENVKSNDLLNLNYETIMRIKEEPKEEDSIDEFDEKPLNINENDHKRVDSQKNVQMKKNVRRKSSKTTNTSESKEATKPKTVTTKKNRNRGRKETTERKTKDMERKRSTKEFIQILKLNRDERRKKERIRRREKKVAKIMIKLMSQMRLIKEDESSSSSSSESSFSSSSESSHSSSSESSNSSSWESCSCSSCYDRSSSDDYSEFTLCSSSNCDSSCSHSDCDHKDK